MFVVIGPTTVDLFVSGLERIPSFGGDEFTTSNLAYCEQPLRMALGGNGAISAYVLAGLGVDVVLCSAVGQDVLGNAVSGWLEERNVKMEGLVRSQTRATSTTTVVTDEALNRLSFHHPGAFHTYGVADIPPELLEGAEVLLVAGYPMLPEFRGGGFAVALTRAHQAGAITALDIGPAIGRPAELAELIPLLPVVDYLIANEHELAVCTGTEDLEAGIDRLRDAGARCVVIKVGKEGAIVCGAAVHAQVPSFDVKPLSTVGAGDSFNSGFLYGLKQGLDQEEATRFGNAVAALVVSSARGVLGSPNPEQVEALLNRG